MLVSYDLVALGIFVFGDNLGVRRTCLKDSFDEYGGGFGAVFGGSSFGLKVVRLDSSSSSSIGNDLFY